MKAIFGVLSLLIVLALGGMLATKQLGAERAVGTRIGASASPSSDVRIPVDPLPGPGGPTIVQQSRAIQDKARTDTLRALQEGDERTRRAADGDSP